MNLEQQILLGQKAQEVLENEAYIDAFDKIQKEINDQWKNSPARDADGRERLWQLQSLLSKLQTTLQSTMQGGKLAARDLRHTRSMLERIRVG
jgi:hypothetical protein